MSKQAKEQIAFDVETSRILQILASEIYDSPKAFLRENVQNAYDAILMRSTAQSSPLNSHKIQLTVEASRIIVQDDGIGMTEEVLKSNFWKAGSSGKKSELAQRSGVIGTFGIGAMANFGVCTSLKVETRHIDSRETLITTANREDLRIAQDCIDLERVSDSRSPGTTIVADLDPSFKVEQNSVCEYLKQYVRFLPVPVIVNGVLISQEAFEGALSDKASAFTECSSRSVARDDISGSLQTSTNVQGRLLARLIDISLGGIPLAGEGFLVQGGGQTLGFRNLFGLAPIPISSTYNFGGFVNLNILHPTAGREALSRESIQQVANIVSLIESEASKDIAETSAADHNQSFQQYIATHGLTQLAKNVTITILPRRDEIVLQTVQEYEPTKKKHYYSGRDQTMLQRFASEQANLLHLSQVNPRRMLQARYLQQVLNIPEVPERTIVDPISSMDLSIEEAMFLVRLRGVLLDDYLMSNIDIIFATISHGVSFHTETVGGILRIAISQSMPGVRMVVECYKTARDVFDGFVKDFVREHVYPHIRDYVPSSTRQGRDALYRRLKENKELFRYEESDFGKVELLLADYLAGKADLEHVLKSSGGRASTQRQRVSKEQVGTVEQVMPDIIEAAGDIPPQNELEAAPPILRPDLASEMKVLTVGESHAKLNNFRMFLALSDRLMRIEGEFLRWPHTTKLIWGMHRVIYIFTDATGGLSLYYDIELKEPLATEMMGGTMIPTTTIITKDRTYIPVPNVLEPAFQITAGAKEFYVRFDTIP
jgi:molecular chaperone HtpG